MTGKPLAVFAALVEVGDEGLTLTELTRAVWDDHRRPDRSERGAEVAAARA